MKKTVNGINFDLLWKLAIEQFAMGNNSIHGSSHWRRVEKNGLLIAKHTNADEAIVKLFAIFHDSKRKNEDHDPEHGLRGAEFAYYLRKRYIPVSDSRFDLLYKACAEHTKGLRSADPTIGTCWDADRIDLDRIGVVARTEFISTVAGRKIISSGGALL